MNAFPISDIKGLILDTIEVYTGKDFKERVKFRIEKFENGSMYIVPIYMIGCYNRFIFTAMRSIDADVLTIEPNDYIGRVIKPDNTIDIIFKENFDFKEGGK